LRRERHGRLQPERRREQQRRQNQPHGSYRQSLRGQTRHRSLRGSAIAPGPTRPVASMYQIGLEAEKRTIADDSALPSAAMTRASNVPSAASSRMRFRPAVPPAHRRPIPRLAQQSLKVEVGPGSRTAPPGRSRACRRRWR
jgi:hypothetical protein